jgi:hypothetical protein
MPEARKYRLAVRVAHGLRPRFDAASNQDAQAQVLLSVLALEALATLTSSTASANDRRFVDLYGRFSGVDAMARLPRDARRQAQLYDGLRTPAPMQVRRLAASTMPLAWFINLVCPVSHLMMALRRCTRDSHLRNG